MKRTLLIVTEFLPYPLKSGGHISQFEMNNAIRTHFKLIMVFPMHSSQDKDLLALREIWPDVEFYPFYNNFQNRISKLIFKKPAVWYYKFLKKLFISKTNKDSQDRFILKNTKLFLSGSFGVEGGLVTHVLKTIKSLDIDFIQVEFYELVTLVSYLPKSIKRIFVNHELRYVREQRELSLLSEAQPYLDYLCTKNKGFEIAFMGEYDKVVTVSNWDYTELSKYLPVEKLFSSSLTIKLPKTSSSKSTNYGEKLIFLGGDDHFPNKQGIGWFMQFCWPKLTILYPMLKLSIVGAWSNESIAKYAKETNVVFHGFVEDLSVILQNGIFIVPIQIGSGMRMKIIDAVNHDLPFVTTTVGVEGLNFTHNNDCLIGDTPDDFTEQIKKIINDAQLADRLATNAKQILIENYSYDKLISKRLSLYETLTDTIIS